MIFSNTQRLIHTASLIFTIWSSLALAGPTNCQTACTDRKDNDDIKADFLYHANVTGYGHWKVLKNTNLARYMDCLDQCTADKAELDATDKAVDKAFKDAEAVIDSWKGDIGQ